MHTETAIVMHGDPDRIFALASEVERWPELLPHYRWVRLLARDGDRRVVEMAATRDGVPLRWTSVQTLVPSERRILFVHVRGITRGMRVEWRIEPRGDGSVDVRIAHDLRWPIGLGWVARHVIGTLFVERVAGKTLRRIKQIAEGSP